ncbi:MAG TPA: TRAP transporter large permease subunit [Chroococcales cyanobacterium]|jgi:tripartite ATP-independent transporter DctM subunit
MTVALSLGLAALTALGLPIFVLVLAIALLGFWMSYGDFNSLAIAVGEIYRIAETPLFIAIPLFTLAGYLMAEAKTANRLIRLTKAFLGWVPSGLSVVALAACAFFTVFTGVSGVTIVALGGILLPALLKEGYPEKFALGLLTTGGSRGMLFPPSLPIILYGVIAQVDVNKLFVAGVVPGILDLSLAMLLCLWLGRKAKVPRSPFDAKEALSALKEAAWELPIPFVIFGGIYGGLITAGETAVVIALYALIVEVFVYRDLSLTKDLPRVLRESMVLVGGIFMVIGAAFALTNFLVDQSVPDLMFETIKPFIRSPLSFLIALNIFLLIVAALLDIYSAILVVLPIILPLAHQYGIDPIHLGIIFLINLEIGYSLPPMGLNLFIASFRFEKPIIDLYRSTVPFLLTTLLVLGLVTYVPDVSLFMLKAFGH